MLVRLHMTRDVITLEESARAIDALRIMRKNHFRHAPVVRDDRLVGIVTERDLLRVLPGSVGALDAAEGSDADTQTVRFAMTTDPTTVAPNDPLSEVARILFEKKVGALPVVDGERLVGIITSIDVMEAFADALTTGDGSLVSFLGTARSAVSCFDFASEASKRGLVLSSLIRDVYARGGTVVVARVEGAASVVDEFCAAASDAGYALIGSSTSDRDAA